MNNKTVLFVALVAGAGMLVLFVLAVNEVVAGFSKGFGAKSAMAGSRADETTDAELDNFHQTDEYMSLLSKRLKSVPNKLKPGHKFDKNSFLPCNCGGAWMILPDWANGVWASAPPFTKTDVWTYDYSTKVRNEKPLSYKAKFADAKEIGIITDKLGRIWHHTCTPYIFREKVNSRELVSQMILADPITVNKDRYGLHWRWIGLTLNADQTIREVFQFESITLFSKAYGKLENVDQTIRKFDADGNPLMEYESFSKKLRIHDFKPVDKQYGNAVAPLFRSYLKRTGQLKLSP